MNTPLKRAQWRKGRERTCPQVTACLDPEPRAAAIRLYRTLRERPINDYDWADWPEEKKYADRIDMIASTLGYVGWLAWVWVIVRAVL